MSCKRSKVCDVLLQLGFYKVQEAGGRIISTYGVLMQHSRMLFSVVDSWQELQIQSLNITFNIPDEIYKITNVILSIAC